MLGMLGAGMQRVKAVRPSAWLFLGSACYLYLCHGKRAGATLILVRFIYYSLDFQALLVLCFLC